MSGPYYHQQNAHNEEYYDTPVPPPPRHVQPPQQYQYDPAQDQRSYRNGAQNQRGYSGNGSPERLPLNRNQQSQNTAYEPVSPIGFESTQYSHQTQGQEHPYFQQPQSQSQSQSQPRGAPLQAVYTNQPPPFQPSNSTRGAQSVLSQSTSRSAYPTSQPTSYPPPVFPSSTSQSSTATLSNIGQHYTDNPYKRVSTTWDPTITQQLSDMDLSLQNPRELMDDEDDDTFAYNPKHRKGIPVASGAGIRDSHTSYDPLSHPEKAGPQWVRDSEDHSRKKRKMWIIIALVVLLLAIGGGVAAGVVLSQKSSSSTSSSSSAATTSDPVDASDASVLTAKSPSVEALLNNPKLHKSFYGMDYTPLNAAQYPECLQSPATQNNVTKDVAVMSQLTDTIRLYGNDCNQTELIIEAIKILNVDMKIWYGVWLDNNVTTGDRQLAHMYNLLDTYGTDMVAGVIIGNENIFRGQATVASLSAVLAEVKTNLTNLKYDIPIATAQLGSSWTAELASSVDVLMANVHPFFAGVTVEDAANWTDTFFQSQDVAVAKLSTSGTIPQSIISEVGWPSEGGRLNGSVAGITEMNKFLDTFICSSNTAGTDYFWFSIFDEPWKIQFDTGNENWEDHWGLMDVNRNLKDGVVLPDCSISSSRK